MKRFLLPLMLFALPFGALADDWKDESGKGRKHDRREFKEEYWDGNCKVERKMEKDGDYKEERKCKAPRRAQYRERTTYVERPVYVEREVYVDRPVRQEVYVDRPVRQEVYVEEPRVREPRVQIDLQIRK